ncbi:MAG TPA: hypothetical protein VKT80_01695, partial [Chloroflexota bacterium]|nr:hypothetical protein [Chloroflexota bacterium]
TLYVDLGISGAPPDHAYPTETTAIRDGRVIAQRPLGFIVARDRPDRWLVDGSGTSCGGPEGGRYRLSPNGEWVLCSDGNDIRLFAYAHPRSARIVVSDFVASQSSFAWLRNDRLVLLVGDQTCPYANLYGFFPARVATFDLSGHRLSTGPCAFGVVGGEHRIALMGERANGLDFDIWQFFHDDVDYFNDGYDRYHHTWSVDGGKTWHDGEPLTFDANDRLLYETPYGNDLKAEDGQTVFTNAYAAQWSR